MKCHVKLRVLWAFQLLLFCVGRQVKQKMVYQLSNETSSWSFKNSAQFPRTHEETAEQTTMCGGLKVDNLPLIPLHLYQVYVMFKKRAAVFYQGLKT